MSLYKSAGVSRIREQDESEPVRLKKEKQKETKIDDIHSWNLSPHYKFFLLQRLLLLLLRPSHAGFFNARLTKGRHIHPSTRPFLSSSLEGSIGLRREILARSHQKSIQGVYTPSYHSLYYYWDYRNQI